MQSQLTTARCKWNAMIAIASPISIVCGAITRQSVGTDFVGLGTNTAQGLRTKR